MVLENRRMGAVDGSLWKLGQCLRPPWFDPLAALHNQWIDPPRIHQNNKLSDICMKRGLPMVS